MKCSNAQKIAYLIARLLPRITEHEWDNITQCDEYEHYICKHCLVVEKRMKTVTTKG